MPKVLQCTAYFGSDAGRGWSESHHLEVATPVGDLLPYLQSFKTLNDNFRRPLLGKDRYLAGLKVSYPTDDGNIASAAYRYQPVAYPGNTRDGCAPSVSALARLGDATNTKFSGCNLRGFWDDVEKNEELNFTTAAGKAWRSLLSSYIAGLVQGGYGWLAADSAFTRRGVVTGYATDADGFVTFTVQVDQGPALPIAGTPPFSIRVAGLNNSKSVLNNTHIVAPVDATHVKTVLRTAALPFQEAGTFVQIVTGLVPYTGLQYVILARRAMGRPTSSSPARLSARPRG